MFAIVFIWTPPHFWPLAMMIQDDYAKVGVPMMPVVDGDQSTAQQMMFYTALLVPTSLLLVYPLHAAGGVYGAIAAVLGGMFMAKVWQLNQTPGDKVMARGVFKFSILYMMLLCAGMGLDSLPLTQSLFNQGYQALQALVLNW
jgi:heme o synthase